MADFPSKFDAAPLVDVRPDPRGPMPKDIAIRETSTGQLLLWVAGCWVTIWSAPREGAQ